MQYNNITCIIPKCNYNYIDYSRCFHLSLTCDAGSVGVRFYGRARLIHVTRYTTVQGGQRVQSSVTRVAAREPSPRTAVACVVAQHGVSFDQHRFADAVIRREARQTLEAGEDNARRAPANRVVGQTAQRTQQSLGNRAHRTRYSPVRGVDVDQYRQQRYDCVRTGVGEKIGVRASAENSGTGVARHYSVGHAATS